MTNQKDDKIGKIGRYYLFYGSNEYLLKQRILSLINTVIPPGGEVFDLDKFNGRRCDIADLLNSFSTPPAMSPLRVTIVEDVDRLPAKSQAALCDALPKIPEYSVLAMTAGKTDKRLKLFKTLLSESKVAWEFNDFSQAEAVEMVRKFAGSRNKKIDPYLADAIVGIFGSDPYRLENEIEKLALVGGERQEIEKKDLAFVSGFSRVETAYDLPELIIEGKIKNALELCDRALASGISEMQIIYLVKNYLERLNTACNLSDAKGLMAIHRMPYQAASRIFSQSKKIRPAAILACLTYIFKAEYSLKSARFPSKNVIELMIIAIYLASGGNKDQDTRY